MMDSTATLFSKSTFLRCWDDSGHGVHSYIALNPQTVYAVTHGAHCNARSQSTHTIPQQFDWERQGKERGQQHNRPGQQLGAVNTNRFGMSSNQTIRPVTLRLGLGDLTPSRK